MNKMQDTLFEIKKIGVSNWQLPDTTTELWRTMTRAAKTEDDWIAFFSSPQLNGKVPEEIAKLMEVARGAMIYSWYFYPLATLGAGQCFRLYDTGTRIRCEQLGIPTKIPTKGGIKRDTSFKDNIDSLLKHGAIRKADEKRWKSIRELRNWASHLERQPILDPGEAQTILAVVVELLNDLFR
jgi:hypothetical protein